MIFKKIKVGKIFLDNRIIIGPMCQYSASEGKPSQWHYKHLLSLSKLGSSLLMIESTAVNKSGRITKKDLELSKNSHCKAFSKLLKKLKKKKKIKIGIQISHSGRKGSSELPWIKSNKPLEKKKGGWLTFAPSAIRRDKIWPVPKELNINEIKKIKNDFKKSANLALKSGFDCLEIHMAHGYLLHQFFSQISNTRADKYGGNLKRRSRFLLEIAKEIRKIWPKKKILGARITGSDNLKAGVKIKDAVYLSKQLKKIGVDYVAVSSGGILPKTNVKFFPGYQVKLAAKIKKNVKIIVVALGMINTKILIKKILKNKLADIVAVSRRFINEPRWLIETNTRPTVIKKTSIPKQYLRCF